MTFVHNNKLIFNILYIVLMFPIILIGFAIRYSRPSLYVHAYLQTCHQ